MAHKRPHRAVIAVFRKRLSAEACYRDLLRRGYLSSDITIMMTDRTRLTDYPWTTESAEVGVNEFGAHAEDMGEQANVGTKAGTKAMEGIAVGGSVGSAVGATLAAIAAVGTSLIIPGLNLVVSGPIMAALAGGGAGAFTGGLVGGLVGLGVPEQDAAVYYRSLQEGGVVMSVEASPEDAGEIKKLMIEHSGQQVCCCNC